MSDDVLITPASRKIEFKDSSGNVDGKIELNSSGDLNITAPGGGLNIGDTSADVFIGDGSANVDIVFEQNGEIRGTTGRTVTLGQNDSNITVDALNFNTSTSTLFKSQNGITSSRIVTDTSGTGGATNISSFTAPHTIQGINNGNTQYALLATLPATTTATLDHVLIEGSMGGWTNNQTFRIKFKRRDSFGYEYTLLSAAPEYNRAGIVAYQASNGTVTVHAKLTASTYGKLTYTISHSFQATIVDKPSLTTSTPAGTLIFDSNDTSTYPPTMKFPDNQKLEFGAGADLRIYHDTSNSIIEDNGTGQLQLKGTVNINNAYTLPTADGSANQVLQTNGNGTLSFATASGGGGAADDITAGDAAVNLTTTSGNITIDAQGNDTDIIFKGTDSDGSGDITALTLDMSEAGTAIFNDVIRLGTNKAIEFVDNQESIRGDGFRMEFKVKGNDVVTMEQDSIEINGRNTSNIHPQITINNNDTNIDNDDEVGTIVGRAYTSLGIIQYTYNIIEFVAEQVSHSDLRGAIEFKVNEDGPTEIYYKISGKEEQNIFLRDIKVDTGKNIIFEGATANDYETTVTVTDPTADRTITLPDASGTVLLNDGNISSSSNITIDAQGGDTDIIFKGTDDTTDITFLTLDGSDRGVLIPGSGSETSHRLQVGSKIAMFDDGNAHLHSLGGTFWINANQAASVRINNQQNGDVILTNGTGKVGIGTDAPSSPLHVVGNVEVQGHVLPTADDTYDLGSSSKQWRDIYTGDINLNNTKTRDNEVDGTRGSWTIQEGADDLFLINRVSGKKYKFKLEEIK